MQGITSEIMPKQCFKGRLSACIKLGFFRGSLLSDCHQVPLVLQVYICSHFCLPLRIYVYWLQMLKWQVRDTYQSKVVVVKPSLASEKTTRFKKNANTCRLYMHMLVFLWDTWSVNLDPCQLKYNLHTYRELNHKDMAVMGPTMLSHLNRSHGCSTSPPKGLRSLSVSMS